MRIAIDGCALTCGTREGETAVAAPLLQQVRAMFPALQMKAFHFCDAASGPVSIDSQNLKPITRRFDAWTHIQFPLAAWRMGADVVIADAMRLPRLCTAPVIVFVDHLDPIESPRGLTVAQVAQFERTLDLVCQRATRIICPTTHLRDRLAQEVGITMDRISVVSPGVIDDVEYLPTPRWHEALSRYDLSRPFVLHYGADEPRRNTRKLIEAWAMTDKKVRQKCQLAIVGLRDDTGEDLVRVVNRLGLASSVRLYKHMADPGDLSALLSAADIAAIPHTWAGFPQQILQAWTTRTAILTSDTGSIAEVAGDAAVQVDPMDSGAIARSITRMVNDGRFRRELIDRGSERLTKFTWQHATMQFARVLADVTGIEMDESTALSDNAIETGETLKRAA